VIDGGGGADIINGAADDDLLRPGADLSADAVNGGAGTDTVDYSNATAGVTVNLQAGVSAGAASGDTYALVEGVIGSNFADDLVARDGGTASGGGGNDILTGAGPGATTILVGGAGLDTLNGSAGQEFMRLELNNGVDALNGLSRITEADCLLVDNAVFNVGLGVTSNEIANQASGAPVATQANAQFIFVQATNELFFDQDGAGGTFNPVLLATVTFTEGPNQIFALDFVVI